jgi:ABC-type lipoprotein export system ATPase subunit
VLEILLDYTRRHHATLLTVTHDRDLLDHFDRVVDLREFSRPSGSAQ